jgi:hypothetical protein
MQRIELANGAPGNAGPDTKEAPSVSAKSTVKEREWVEEKFRTERKECAFQLEWAPKRESEREQKKELPAPVSRLLPDEKLSETAEAARKTFTFWQERRTDSKTGSCTIDTKCTFMYRNQVGVAGDCLALSDQFTKFMFRYPDTC